MNVSSKTCQEQYSGSHRDGGLIIFDFDFLAEEKKMSRIRRREFGLWCGTDGEPESKCYNLTSKGKVK